MNEMTTTADASNIIEQVIAKGDLSKLTADQRNTYYNEVCRSLGLNPLTQPFAYIQLQGKLVLYARRDCCDQLRKLRSISVEIVSQKIDDDLLTVHVRARDLENRRDEDFGVVAFPPTLKGEYRANAIMRAVTKAKRRVTLSICGLGLFDETEIEDTPPRKPKAPGPNVIQYNPDAIEQPADSVPAFPLDEAPAAASPNEPTAAGDRISDSASETAASDASPGEPAAENDKRSAAGDNPDEVQSADMAETDRALTRAAALGTDELRRVWLALKKERRQVFASAMERRFKPAAAKVDAERARSTT